MAKSYLDLMKQARQLAERDIHRIVAHLQEYAQHVPEMVEKAVGAITHHKGVKTTAAVTTAAAPVKAAAPATATVAAEKPKSKRTKLTKAEAEALRGMVKSALKGKVKQVDFIEKFLAEHRKFKEATVQKIVTDFRKSKVFKDEPVAKGNSKAGIYLLPGK